MPEPTTADQRKAARDERFRLWLAKVRATLGEVKDEDQVDVRDSG